MANNNLYVKFNKKGVPNIQVAGYIRKGNKNNDAIYVRFEDYNNADLMCLLNGERADGKSIDTPLIMHVMTDDDGLVWYYFVFGDYEPEDTEYSWWTAVDGFIKLNISIMDDERLYVTGTIKIGVEWTASQTDPARAKEFNVIGGIYEELSTKVGYLYFNTENNKKLDKDFTNFETFDWEELRDGNEYVAINKNDNTGNYVGKAKLEDLYTRVNHKVPTNGNLDLNASDIPYSQNQSTKEKIDSVVDDLNSTSEQVETNKEDIEDLELNKVNISSPVAYFENAIETSTPAVTVTNANNDEDGNRIKTTYAKLSDIEEQIQSDWNESNSTSKAYIKNKPSVEQSDWNENDNTSIKFIKNKPTIPNGFRMTQVYAGEPTLNAVTSFTTTYADTKLLLISATDPTGYTHSFSIIPDNTTQKYKYTYIDNGFVKEIGYSILSDVSNFTFNRTRTNLDVTTGNISTDSLTCYIKVYALRGDN